MKRIRMRINQKALSLLCILTLLITMMPSIAFTAFAGQTSDISNHWAKAQINDLLEKGYITGYQDGTFKPDKNITRAEFMAIINRAFHFTEKAEGSFTDVKDGAWYADVVRQAKAAGYIGGYPDGSIRPDNAITRQEAAAIIAKIKNLSKDESAAAGFKDASRLAGWSKGDIGAVTDCSLMNGYPDGSFQAANNITRAEAAAVLDKALVFEAYSAAGTYGPESGVKTVTGNVGAYSGGVTIQNMIIEGNLLLAASIGDGTVTLKNVTVKGTTNIKGGGEHSIIVIDSTLGSVRVIKEDGKVRIVVSGNTTVGQVTAASGVKLEEISLTGGAAGFREIVIEASGNDTISLVGTFDRVTIETAGMTVNVPSGTTVNTMVLNKAASVTGTGTIQQAQVNTSGTTFEKQPATQTGSGAASQTGKSTGGKSGSSSSSNSTYADLVLTDGVVYSVNSVGPVDSIYDIEADVNQAVAIKDGVIAYVGTNAGASSYIGSKTQIIDLDGKMVVPGFADSHAHAKAMTANLYDLSLYADPSPDGVIKQLEAWKSSPLHSSDTYITGNGWDTLQSAGMIAKNEELNEATGDIPVVLYDASHHQAWANEAAIEKAGITKDTPKPPGGVIGKDEVTGELTGIFQEDSAIGLVMKAIPDNTVEQYEQGILAYQAMANSEGLTLNQDPQVSENCIKAYENLAKEGLLTMRFRGGYLSAPVVNTAGDAFAEVDDPVSGPAVKTKLDKLASDSAVKHEVGDLFQMNFIKIYGDGGGPTTWMKDGSAANVWPQDQLNYLCDQLEKNGVQIHCHSMGEAALASFLEAFQYASDQGDTARRNSITHLQYVDDGTNGIGSTDDATSMAALGVIGIPQPFWMVKDPYLTMYWPYCGKDRTAECYPMKSLIEKGVIMAGGSDWPVTQPNSPLTSIQTGITRTLPYDDPAIAYTPDMQRNPMFRTPLGSQEDPEKDCVNLETMIQSVTINGAYAMYLEDITGSIKVGKSADMVVLDKDLRDVSPADIGKTNVLMTLFKGNIVYAASQPTVKEHAFVTLVPVYPGNPDPYFLITAPFPMTAADLKAALNPPVDGSIEVVDAGDNPVSDGDDLTMGMKLVSTCGTDTADYPVVLASPPNFSTFGAIGTTTCAIDIPDAPPGTTADSDCVVIKLDTPLPDLTAADVYLLRTEDDDNISAKTVAVEDVSNDYGYDTNSGNVYLIKALDPEVVNIPFVGPVLSYEKPLSGTYSIWVYSPVNGDLTIFVNNGAEVVNFD